MCQKSSAKPFYKTESLPRKPVTSAFQYGAGTQRSRTSQKNYRQTSFSHERRKVFLIVFGRMFSIRPFNVPNSGTHLDVDPI